MNTNKTQKRLPQALRKEIITYRLAADTLVSIKDNQDRRHRRILLELKRRGIKSTEIRDPRWGRLVATIEKRPGWRRMVRVGPHALVKVTPWS